MSAPLSLLDVIQKTTDFLASKGVESARLNAELLIGHALGLKRMQLYLQFERVLPEADLEKIRPLVKRRSQREPLQYILGDTEWSGLRLKVDRRALIPRHETELLIEKIVERLVAPPGRVLDLGTGTGAIALALATRYPEAIITAVDLSEDALALAAENARLLDLAERVTFARSRWYDSIDASTGFDLVVSNPPYLTEAETASAEPEVRAYEPLTALTAADAGLADLRTIIVGASSFLKPGGLLALETGIAQHAELTRLLTATGFSDIESRTDYTDRDRFLLARLGEP